MHILVVEDDDAIRHAIVRNLAHHGYQVHEAGTAAQAGSSVLDGRPDLIVLDINLPDASGWDVLRRLAAWGVPLPRVVAISAIPPPESRLVEFENVRFLPKPFVISALLRMVNRALAQEHDDERPADSSH